MASVHKSLFRIFGSHSIMLVVSYILANREVLAPYLWRLLNHVLS